MIDVATRDPVEAARGADLIVLAVPILTMRATLEKMIEHTAPDAVVTDVGSVKGYVVRELEPLITGKRSLVAAHPVAGKETTGAAAADPALFRDRRVIHHAVGQEHARGDQQDRAAVGRDRRVRRDDGRCDARRRSSRARAICRRRCRACWLPRSTASKSATSLRRNTARADCATRRGWRRRRGRCGATFLRRIARRSRRR